MERERCGFGRVVAVALLLAAGLGSVAFLPGCSPPDDGWPKEKAGPKVVVSFAPLYCFAANVAGDDAVVRNLLTTSGPHHFNPTDQDARLVRRADIFFVVGIGLEGDKPEGMKKGSGNKSLKIIELGAKISDEKLLVGSCNHDHGDGQKHDHGKDPHVWLSPDYAILLVEGIRDELKAADSAHAANYDRRATEYIGKLNKLKADGIAMLKEKKDRKLVTFHDSMTYFAKSFDLQIAGVVQKNPGSEPNDTELRRLILKCADPQNPVRVVAVEPQYGNSNAGTELVKNLKQNNIPDPVLVELDPLETVAPDQLTPDWYEKKMLANLEALARAMK